MAQHPREKLQRKKLEKVLEYQVAEKPINDVKPDPTNPNVMSDEKFKALKIGLKEHFPYPIIVDQNNIIIDGFHRWKAWKELGNKTVPCIVQYCKNEVDRKIWRQVYNKVRGEHDKTKDSADFLAIFNSKRTSEFLKLVGTQKDSFLQLIGKKLSLIEEMDFNFKPKNIIKDDISDFPENFRIIFNFKSISDYEFVMQSLKKIGKNKEYALLKLIR